MTWHIFMVQVLPVPNGNQGFMRLRLTTPPTTLGQTEGILLEVEGIPSRNGELIDLLIARAEDGDGRELPVEPNERLYVDYQSATASYHQETLMEYLLYHRPEILTDSAHCA